MFTVTVLCNVSVEPEATLVTVTGISITVPSSSAPQSIPVGVPIKLPFSSTDKPLTVEDETVEVLFVSTAFTDAGTA
ncbi:MAG: hypothetical protein ACOX1M_01505 [Erysipelotrichaceae bacterium]